MPRYALEILAAALVVLWVVGLVARVAGSMIHLALVLALVLVAVRFLRGSGRQPFV